MKQRSRLSWSIVGAGLGLLLVLACVFVPVSDQGSSQASQQASEAPITEPPSAQQSPGVTEAPVTEPPSAQKSPGVTETSPTEPTTTDHPCDRARLVAEEIAPTDVDLLPAASFTKTWHLQNLGNCTWTTAYQVAFADGEIMSAPNSVSLPANVAPGQMVDVSIPMTAPDVAGNHTGYWLFKNANGVPFDVGDNGQQRLSVIISVIDVTSGSTSVPVDQQAMQLASTASQVVSESFGVQINPDGAAGLDAKLVNETPGDLAGWMAPVVDAHQTYTDRFHVKREVEGVIGIKSASLRLDTTIIVNKTYRFYSPLPPGQYVIACHIQRSKDCIAVSLEGKEYQIRPASIDTEMLPPTSFPGVPSVQYDLGSIHKCFRIAWRRICIRVF